jgi:pyruvate dehydrogenase E1 component alpha subunit
MPGVVVDAVDYEAVWAAAGEAVRRARAGEGPTLLEAKIPRHMGHFVGDPEGYRSRDDRRAARARDPIAGVRDRLAELGVDVDAIVTDTQAALVAELDDAVAAALAAPWPDPAEVELHVHA